MAKKSLGVKCISKTRVILQKFDKELSYKIDAYRFGFRKKDVKARLKRIAGGYNGSNTEYREIVLKYWAQYGIKPQKEWYDLYCADMKTYNPHFIPDPIWFRFIVPYFNSTILVPAYADKGIYNRLIQNVKKPETIVKRTAGYFYNGDGEQLISREEAESLCEREEHLIFKPSGGTKGAGILFYDRDNSDSKSVADIFDEIKGGFVAQRIVRQHADLSRLNPNTLNTIRVISFHFKGEVHILSAQLRIGGEGSRVDNVSAGGSACAVKPDGWLHEKSVTRKSTWTDKTANGILLNSICIPNYELIKETVKNLHRQLPYFNIVGWDMAVGQDGTPIFIEFNTKPGQNQIGGREPTFGELTDEVLEEVFIKKSSKKVFK